MPSKKINLNVGIWDGKKPLEERKLDQIANKFIKNYTGRHGQIKVLGMTEPIPLDHIYTAVRMASPAYLHDFATPNDLKSAFLAQGRRGFAPEREKKQNGIEVANEVQFLNVLGQPGAGKSTFLRRVGLEALPSARKRDYKHRCIPVFIELKTFNADEADLTTLVEQEFVNCGFPKSYGTAALEQGKLLVLLDGLDEAPAENLQQTIQHIRDFVDRYSENRFITSCRTAFYNRWFNRFTDVVLADFDDQQIQTFIENWFHEPEDRTSKLAEEFWNILRRPEHAATLELARTPLLLTFLCLVYKRTRNLPGNRSYLYKRALDILLEEWAAEKLVQRPKIYDGLYPDLEVQLLGQIAGPSFAEDSLFFTQEELVGKINNFLANELSAPKKLNGAQVLKAIEVQQGLIVQRAHDAYSFSHLTLHEYLAARHFLEHGRVTEIVDRHLFDERWREVFLLLAGMAQADVLLNGMVAKTQQRLLDQPKLAGLVRWTESVIADAPDENTAAAAKAAAVFFALERASNLTRTIAFYRTIDLTFALGLTIPRTRVPFDVLDRAILRSLARHFVESTVFKPEILALLTEDLDNLGIAIPREDPPAGQQQPFVERNRYAATSGLGLQQQFSQWPPDDAERLEKYLYASLLIVQCKKAALSVSKQGWSAVLKRFLTAPPEPKNK